MQSGLWSEEGRVPLASISVKGKIRDYLAEVQVNQRYIHRGNEPIETTFKFPLDLFGALIGFSVTVDGKTVEAKITPRSVTEVSSPTSKQTPLSPSLEEDNQPELFVCSISDVQPNKEVDLELRYATELVVEHGASLRFVLPPSVISPGSSEDNTSNNSANQDDHTEETKHQLNIELDVELPEEFSLDTPTHKDVSIKKDNGHVALIKLNKDSDKREPSFVILFNMKGSVQPWVCVSKHQSSGVRAALLSFFPQFEVKRQGPSEIVFMLDRSGITNLLLQNVKEAVQLFLRSLSPGVHFNIIAFGSTFIKMSKTSVEYNQQSLDMANQFVEKMNVEPGRSKLMEPLSESSLHPL